MPNVLDQLTAEWGESLKKASLNPPKDFAEAKLVATFVVGFVQTLASFWRLTEKAARRGGLPGKTALRQCDVLLRAGATPDEAFRRIEEYAATVPAVDPAELASLRELVAAGRKELDQLRRQIDNVRSLLTEPPRISIRPEDLKRLTDQAD